MTSIYFWQKQTARFTIAENNSRNGKI